jgi:hypothetical protein
VADDGHKGGIDSLRLRAYFATIVGQARAPFGQRKSFSLAAVGDPLQLAQNSTRDKILFVTVSRSDLSIATVAVIFSQQSSGGSLNDFVAPFVPLGIFRFVLYPGESLAVQGAGGAFSAIDLSVGTESY